MVVSSLADATTDPSPINVTEFTPDAWPEQQACRLPDSQILTDPSFDPDAMRRPSSLNATEETVSVCPLSVYIILLCFDSSDMCIGVVVGEERFRVRATCALQRAEGREEDRYQLEEKPYDVLCLQIFYGRAGHNRDPMRTTRVRTLTHPTIVVKVRISPQVKRHIYSTSLQH